MPKSSLIHQAAELLRAGKLVAFPTETVYGLGADARNEDAIKRVFNAKQRPLDHPLIVHIADSNELHAWATDISAEALLLAQTFWPGPLTLILRKQPQVSDLVTAQQATVGLRMPNHPMALELLRAFGGGVVAPSANQFTHLSPTTADAVREELGEQVDLILDGGPCTVGVESTIIDMSGDQPSILRPGMITSDAISAVLKRPVLSTTIQSVRVPGMHHLHYAPQTKTVVVRTHELPQVVAKSLQHNRRSAVLMWSNNELSSADLLQVVHMPRDAKNYAHDLYHTLRQLDQQGFQQIIIEAVPDDTAWAAIRDRIFKASGSREIK